MKDKEIKMELRILSMSAIVIIILQLILLWGNITGFAVYGNYSDTFRINVEEDMIYNWLPSEKGSLESLMLNGYFEGDSFSVYLFDRLVYSYGMDVTPKSAVKVSDGSGEINLELNYGNAPGYDNNNDGISYIDGVIDFAVNISSNFDADYSNICTKYVVHNIDDNLETSACYGNTECCAFLNLENLGNWDDLFYLNYGKYGAGYNNTVDAQLVYYDVNVSELKTDIYSSDKLELPARFIDRMYFTDACVDSCILPLYNFSSYDLNITVDGRLYIDQVVYTLESNKTKPVRLNDGKVRIMSGNPPTVSSLSLTTTDPLTNDTDQNLTISSLSASDLDGDNITLVYNWYKNDNLNATTLITNGLVSYLPLNNDSLDYFGNNDGTPVGMEVCTGQEVTIEIADYYCQVRGADSPGDPDWCNSFPECSWSDDIGDCMHNPSFVPALCASFTNQVDCASYYSGFACNSWNLKTPVSGKVGGAYEFDGAGEYIELGNSASLNISQNISMSLWVKPKSLAPWATMIGKNYFNGVSNVGAYSFKLDGDGNIYLFLNLDTGPISLQSGIPPAVNEWNHLAFTFNGSTADLYMNSTLIGTQNLVGLLNTTNNAPLVLGVEKDHLGNLGAYYWNGSIDEAMIFNRTLNASEIKMIYEGSRLGGDKLSSDLTSANDVWKVGVVPYDYLSVGNEVNSNNVTILGGAAPLFAGGDGTAGYPYQIVSWTQLNNTRTNLSAYYILMNNLSSSDGDYSGLGNNWTQIGASGSEFAGSFNGNNYIISNLTISKTGVNFVGLFGDSIGNISNLGLININVTGGAFVGGLVGRSTGTISNSSSSGIVLGSSNYVGGLVGRSTGTISNSSSSGSVLNTGSGTGGLVGESIGIINNSYSTVNVNSSSSYVGGLAGSSAGTISNSYSTGNVLGGSTSGGLVGSQAGGTISNSYSMVNGTISSNSPVGTLVGNVGGGCTIINSYSIVESYAIVSADSNVGLIGSNSGTVTNSYLTIRNTTYGNITFLELVTGVTGNMLGNITIGNNSVYVNSAQSGLNKSANVTLLNLPQNFANPVILKDGFACLDCYNFTSLNAGDVVFNVTSWSNYSIGEGETPSCPAWTTDIGSNNCLLNNTHYFNDGDSENYAVNLVIGSNGSIANYSTNINNHGAGVVLNFTTITVQSGGNVSGGNITIYATNLSLIGNAKIYAAGLGYANSSGPGAGSCGWSGVMGGGGGHGGNGGNGNYVTDVSGGLFYDSSLVPIMFGSGGGCASYWGNIGGSGGGIIIINSQNLILNGSIISSGAERTCAGAGAGGSIYITTNSLSGSGNFNASGGTSKGGCESGWLSGGGSGGRIAVYYNTSTFTGINASSVAGGSGGFIGGSLGTLILIDRDDNSATIKDGFRFQGLTGIANESGTPNQSFWNMNTPNIYNFTNLTVINATLISNVSNLNIFFNMINITNSNTTLIPLSITFENSSAGKASFSVNGTNFYAELSYVIISSNLISVDSGAYPQLNVSAKLTLYNTNSLGFTNRQPYRNGQVCPASICREINDADNYIFNVTGFTNYSVGEGLNDCGTLNIPNHVYNLISNVSSTGTCFNITADNVTLDGNGKTITFNTGGTSNQSGIVLSGARDNITIKNTNIMNGSYFVAGNTYGIYSPADSNISNSLFYNNTINSDNYGIKFYLSYNNNFSSNNIFGRWDGLNFFLSSNDQILSNIINGDRGYGLSFYDNASNDVIFGNTIRGYDDAGNAGIYFTKSGAGSAYYSNITISYNNISGSPGIHLGNAYVSFSNIIISHNHIVAIYVSGIKFNEYFGSNSSFVTIADNNITSQRDAIIYQATSSGDVISNNTLTSGNGYYDLHIASGSITNLSLINQTITTYNFEQPSTINFEGTSTGKIEFTNPISGSGNNLIGSPNADIVLGNGFAYVNGSAASGGLNSSANVTLYNLDYNGSYPELLRKILKDGVECGADCINFTSLTKQNITFSVPNW